MAFREDKAKMIILPKKTSYDLPEGSYRGFLKEVFTLKQSDTNGREGQVLRLVFQITSLKHPRIVYLAGKNYSLADAKKLANDLDSWIGDELAKLVDANGALSIENIEAQKGREADIDVVHIDNESHETAFRHIQRILPPGTLVDDSQLGAAA
jgi:hypothetical protein